MVIPKVIQQITNAPLPLMLERLGASIANAQMALDANSIKLASEMTALKVTVGDQEYNLLSLGFTPTFYAFTEASLEMKMEFSLAESESFGGSVDVNLGNNGNQNNSNSNATNGNSGEKSTLMFGVSFSAHYARKYSASAEGSSSIAAKIVSLPAPDVYMEVLKLAIKKEE
ncbi:MAG: hypothetical protein HC854_03835 [Flavobacterium sp.]|nr:hypothetical protein [Flavobacterium sp.]